MRSSRVDTFTLVTLGRLTLLSASGQESESLAKRRLKLALLAVLALARRPLSRATLAEMFWGDQDESRARHSLSDALSHLRRELGRSAIATHETDVSLDPDAPVIIDAVMFADAADAKNYARATELYAGPFLDGVEIEAGPSFEQWVTRERRRLETAFLNACAHQCLAFARAREWDRCGALASRWLDAAPLSVDAALFRLNAVKAPGTREAAQRALHEFDQLTARLAREFELAPEKPVRQLVESIREGMTSLPHEAVVVEVPAPEPVVVEPNEPPLIETPKPATVRFAQPRPTWRKRATQFASSAVAGVVLLTAAAARTRTTQEIDPRPRVAIAVDVPASDSATAWLADGLPQMIVSELARSPELEVIPPAQVRALLQRRGTSRRTNDDADELRDLGRRLGATILVNATVGHDDRSLVLDLTVRDAATGRLLRNDALSQPDAVTLADEAAARVLAAVNAARPGNRIADLETSSVEAYQHFIRAVQLGQDGRNQESLRELDAAIALDSGFVSAVNARIDAASWISDYEVINRLRAALQRNGMRETDFDRLLSDSRDALHAGELEHSEAIARQLVRRYPRDPRAYGALSAVLSNHGKFDEAEALWKKVISLDSLTVEAGSGPCSPCAAYGLLARMQMSQGKWAEAERVVRRWVQLQPDVPASWEALATLLAYQQRDPEAIDAMKRAVQLSGNDPMLLEVYGRVLLMLRHYDEVDSLTAVWMASTTPDLQVAGYDIRVLSLRERGQLRAANAVIDRVNPALPNAAAITDLMRGSTLARQGDYARATLVYERSAHGPKLEPPPQFPPPNTAARGFCWHHALLADAIAPSGDLARLRGIADTLEIGCARSYFGRDRKLYHHVRGLIASQEGRWLEAESELRQAQWATSETWTRTNVALARAQLKLGKADAAIATLRDGYASLIDGMARYQPRSELDLLLAEAYRKAGLPDSAAVYDVYARRAFRDADPEVKRTLDLGNPE